MTDVIRPPGSDPVLVSTSRGGRGSGTAVAPSDAPLVSLAVVVLRHLRLLILIPLSLFVLTVVVFLWQRQFWAQSKLAPQAQQEAGASGLAGLAATFGVNVPTGRMSESLDFYSDLLKSREILDSVALTSFRFPAGRGERDTLSGTYIELYEIKGNTQQQQLTRARSLLARNITVTTRRPAGLVTLRTTARWPRLAELLNRRLLDLVNQFNTQRRMSQAGAERRFLEGRLADARQDLDQAREAQRLFLEKNRVWQSDPLLSLEMQKINDAVSARTSLVQTLSDNYEKARLDEVRNTPVITVVESPEGSRKREGGLITTAFAALVVGGVLALGLALLQEYSAREQALNPEAYDVLRRLWRGKFGRRSRRVDG